MKRLVLLAALVLLILGVGGYALAAGVALAPHVNVLAPTQAVADEVLLSALAARREIAQRWLHRDVPPADCPLMITITETDGPAWGVCWLREGPRRRWHKVWVYGPPGSWWPSLRHEVAHCVFAGAGLSRAEQERRAEIEEERAR